jgi:rhodanese-related sulfurtransferase
LIIHITNYYSLIIILSTDTKIKFPCTMGVRSKDEWAK